MTSKASPKQQSPANAQNAQNAQSESFDLVVIGAGPGGYVGAIRAAQLGMKVAMVEKDNVLGGTCLNRGCIPSKALLESSYLYHKAHVEAQEHGLNFKSLSMDVARMVARKELVVSKLTGGIDGLFKKNKIARFVGEGSVSAAHEVTVTVEGKKQTLQAKNILLATGSVPSQLPNVEMDGVDVVTSTEALNFTEVPENLVVIGGGYIGLELGVVWARLGSKVKVVEFMDRLLPNMDGELGKQLKIILEKQGLEFFLKTKVEKVEKSKKGILKVVVSSGDSTAPGSAPAPTSFVADKVLMAVGRRPYTQGLGLDHVGVESNERGFVKVNSRFQTNVPHIYAVGDLIGGAMLAHKAEEEGIAAVECMHGESPEVNYALVPSILYTHPEVAAVGQSEEQLKAAGIPYKKGSFPIKANGRALAVGETDGFVKILAHEKTDEILGAHIIAGNASEMIHELCVAMEFNAKGMDVAMTMHAHPTLSECIKEASLALHKRSIHS